MSRGKNAFRRGNRTLAWYLGDKYLDKAEERDSTPSPCLNRKSSMDSESSLNSNGKQTTLEGRKKRERKNRSRQRRNAQNQKECAESAMNIKADKVDSAPVAVSVTEPIETLKLRPTPGMSQSVPTESDLRQQFNALAVAGQKDRENYWYYDHTSDGFYYEHNGSRGWRKRNPKLHGNPPISTISKLQEEAVQRANQTQQQESPQVQHTVEKKVYVPVPVPVFPSHNNKVYSPGTGSNIKYYDAATDGYFFEMASVDGWRRRQPSSGVSPGPPPSRVSSKTNFNQKLSPSFAMGYSALGRDLTNQEVEDLVLSNVDATTFHSNETFNLPPFSMENEQKQVTVLRASTDDYPSSSSTVSSSVSDDVTPPPPSVIGLAQETLQKQPVGSFDEPYEFYWSDNEKADRVDYSMPQNGGGSGSDLINSSLLTNYFNDLCVNSEKQMKRPDSLRIDSDDTISSGKRLPQFNVDQFIADLPGLDQDAFINNLSSLCTPLQMDTPRTPAFNQIGSKDSPFFTPLMNKENTLDRLMAPKRHHEQCFFDTASFDIERNLKDLEKIWHSGF